MIPTSGTTGRSKLVMQTHRAYVMAGEGFPWWMRLTADDRLMTSLPAVPHQRARVLDARLDRGAGEPRAAARLLGEHVPRRRARQFGATEFNSIGAMLEILMRQPPRADDADNPLRLCYTGPSPDRERQLEIEERFGFEIVCGYALSESPYALIWRHGERPYGTLGSARQHPTLGHVNDARVVDDGRIVGPGETGELELRNPAIMRGYYEMPDETAAVIVDGWLRTGDLVRVNDDETYTFVGRKKEVIRRRGENLSPAEVEAGARTAPRHRRSRGDRRAVGPVGGRREGVRRRRADGRDRRSGGRARVRERAPRSVQGAALRRGGRRAAAHGNRPARQAQALARAQRRRGRLRGGRRAPSRRRLGPHVDRLGATRDAITVAGRDLPADIMGKLTLTELAYLLVTRREPTAAQTRLLDAVLVSLADHGLTPSALAARLTYTGAPEAVQGAIAAGLLGAGSVFLGPAGDTAQFLFDALQAEGGARPIPTTRTLTRIAESGGRRARRAAGRRVPGLGHPVHKDVDPRTPRLYAIAAEEGLLGPHLRLLEKVGDVNEQRTGRHLPVNGAGAGGAALVDLGLPPSSARGVVLIARTAGLVAHLVEEAEQPIGLPLWLEVERRASED